MSIPTLFHVMVRGRIREDTGVGDGLIWLPESLEFAPSAMPEDGGIVHSTALEDMSAGAIAELVSSMTTSGVRLSCPSA